MTVDDAKARQARYELLYEQLPTDLVTDESVAAAKQVWKVRREWLGHVGAVVSKVFPGWFCGEPTP